MSNTKMFTVDELITQIPNIQIREDILQYFKDKLKDDFGGTVEDYSLLYYPNVRSLIDFTLGYVQLPKEAYWGEYYNSLPEGDAIGYGIYCTSRKKVYNHLILR